MREQSTGARMSDGSGAPIPTHSDDVQTSLRRRRTEQVDLKLQREVSRKAAQGKCSLCCLSIKYCICKDLAPLPAPSSFSATDKGLVFISLVVSAYERERASSTHKLVLATLGPSRCNLFISDGPEHGGAEEIWTTIYSQALREGRRVCFLWPGDGSISFRSFIQQQPRGEYQEDRVLQRDEMGIQTERESLQKFLVIAFDGTWPNARKTQRDIELAALKLSSYSVDRCFVDNSIVSKFALFSPLRRQPTIDRVSTLEAVACCFDEVELAIQNKKLNGKTFSKPAVNHSKDTVASISNSLAKVDLGKKPELLIEERKDGANSTDGNIEKGHDLQEIADDSTKKREVDIDKIERDDVNEVLDDDAQFQPQHPHEVILPACASYVSRTLRYNLLVLVDSLLREKGMISPNPHARGTGYRTWKLPASEIGPQLGLLPAHLLERIATFAYGSSAVYPSGLMARGPKRTMQTHWGSAPPTKGECVDNDKGGKHTKEEKDDGDDDNDDVTTVRLSKTATLSKSPELNKRLCQGGLPSLCAPFNTTALARTNSHLFVLFSGYVKFEDMRRKKRLDRAPL